MQTQCADPRWWRHGCIWTEGAGEERPSPAELNLRGTASGEESHALQMQWCSSTTHAEMLKWHGEDNYWIYHHTYTSHLRKNTLKTVRAKKNHLRTISNKNYFSLKWGTGRLADITPSKRLNKSKIDSKCRIYLHRTFHKTNSSGNLSSFPPQTNSFRCQQQGPSFTHTFVSHGNHWLAGALYVNQHDWTNRSKWLWTFPHRVVIVTCS